MRSVWEEIANEGSTLQGNQNAPLVQGATNDQFPVNSQAMMVGEVRVALIQMAQDISTQAQAIKAQDNREVVPRENEHASTITNYFLDFMRVNPPMYFG